MDHLHQQAEIKLQNLTYARERKKWNFELFVTAHKDKHTILEGLTEHGYKSHV